MSAKGVQIIGTGSAVPEGKITNADLEKIMDTSDEWIVQRTGIRERRISDPTKGETTLTLSKLALERAIESAGIAPTDLDLIILGSVTGEMRCPATACRLAAEIGAGTAGAFDLLAACSGWLYALNTGSALITAGQAKNVAVVGCDLMSRIIDYENRAVSILFGDAAGAAILQATDDESKGSIASCMHADGSQWHNLYLPCSTGDYPPKADLATARPGALQMNGREVYKFAVGTFSKVIEQTLERAGISADEVDQFVCHQSNLRMLESARDRFGVPEEKFYVNIDRYGNCSAGSVPVCLDELVKAGKCKPGELVLFVAFGGGLTWAANLWRM